MSSSISPGAVVDAVTSRGLSPVIVESVSGNNFSGLLVMSRDIASVRDYHEGLVDEVILTRSERACVIRSEDDENVGILVIKDDDGVMLYHLDNGQRIAPAKTPEGVLKIAVRTLEQYARAATDEGQDWSATARQARNLSSDVRSSVIYLNHYLDWA